MRIIFFGRQELKKAAPGAPPEHRGQKVWSVPALEALLTLLGIAEGVVQIVASLVIVALVFGIMMVNMVAAVLRPAVFTVFIGILAGGMLSGSFSGAAAGRFAQVFFRKLPDLFGRGFLSAMYSFRSASETLQPSSSAIFT